MGQPTKRLYWNYGHLYNATNSSNPCFGYRTLDDTTGTAKGIEAWRLEGRSEKYGRGGCVRLPKWFANAYTGGKSLGVGFGGNWSVITTASLGPALCAVTDPDVFSWVPPVLCENCAAGGLSLWGTREGGPLPP